MQYRRRQKQPNYEVGCRVNGFQCLDLIKAILKKRFEIGNNRGRVNGWGVVDAHALPAQLGYDMFTVIRLAPGGDRVLGTGDRLSAASPPDRIAQYCTSDGENTSSEPTHFVAQEVQSEVSLVPDPQRPGFGLVGARPGHDTITAASGVFAGRTGHVDISGSVDLRRFPAAAPFEGVSLVSLGP